MKCRECEFASVHTYPRNGNSNSAHVGHFGQEASFCNHPQCPPPGPLLFYGKTAPRYCPLKKKERKSTWGKSRLQRSRKQSFGG